MEEQKQPQFLAVLKLIVNLAVRLDLLGLLENLERMEKMESLVCVVSQELLDVKQLFVQHLHLVNLVH
jgi:hypothetical protein